MEDARLAQNLHLLSHPGYEGALYEAPKQNIRALLPLKRNRLAI